MKIDFSDLNITLRNSILSSYSQLNEEENLSDILLKVVEIERKNKLRYGKKKVYISSELLYNPLYKIFKNKINEFISGFENDNFESFKNSLSHRHKNISYKDTFLDTLYIEHFHLKENPRVNELLFVKYDKYNNVYFINIYNHRNFFDKEVIRVISNNWSHLLSDIELPIKMDTSFLSDKDFYILTKNLHINCFYSKINGKDDNKVYGTFGVLSNGVSREDYEQVLRINADIEFFENNKHIISHQIIDFMKSMGIKKSLLRINAIWHNSRVKLKEINTGFYIDLNDKFECSFFKK